MRQIGERRREEALLREALDIYERAKSPPRGDYEACLNNLCAACNDTGRHEEAEVFGRRAWTMAQQLAGITKLSLCIALENYISARLSQRKTDAETEKLLNTLKEKADGLTGQDRVDEMSEVHVFEMKLHHLTGRHEEVFTAEKAIRQLTPRDPNRLTNLAIDLSTYANLDQTVKLSSSQEKDKLRQRYLDEVMAVLKEAIASGYADVKLLQTHRAFEGVRHRDDFRQLLASMGRTPDPSKPQ